MIKVIIFDLDGVLVDARELHYEALNLALEDVAGTKISRDEHLSTFDGLSTMKKLRLLSDQERIKESDHALIWKKKQEKTIDVINSKFQVDVEKQKMLTKLKSEGYRLVCCTNSIRETAQLMLIRTGLMEFFEHLIANTDVRNPKPNPEVYLRAFVKLGLRPKDCLIVEDSHHGRKAAIDSGAHLCPVKDIHDVTYNKVKLYVDKSSEHNRVFEEHPRWQGGNMNIVIPISGKGSSFEKAGYTFPKPLIDIKGKPMIQLVVENINADGNFIFLVLKEHYEKFNMQYLFNLIAPKCQVVVVDQVTNGAACTVLLAEKLIDNDDPLVIINGDQFLEWNSNEFFYSMLSEGVTGGIVTFNSTHPKWSFVKTDEQGFVSEVAEKKPISNIATAGVYYYETGSDFVRYAKQMISKGNSTRGEFFVAPVYNEVIQDGKKVKTFQIDKTWSLGTPEDLRSFIENCKCV